MNLHELSELIERYLPMWRRYAAYRCKQCGFAQEADDILGDALEVLCSKEVEVLAKMRQCETTGDLYLRNFVFAVIKNRIRHEVRNHRKLVPVDYLHISDEQDADDHSFACTDAARDATAQLREDSFITAEPVCKVLDVRGSVSQCIIRGKVTAFYRASINQGKKLPIRRVFPTRHAAFKFLIKQAQQQQQQ